MTLETRQELVTDFHRLSAEGPRVWRLTRSTRPFATDEELVGAHRALTRFCEGLPRSRSGLWVDLRRGPPRNDPRFERLIVVHLPPVYEEWAAMAYVVATAAGRLQVLRHLREGPFRGQVFLDEGEARRALDEQLAAVPKLVQVGTRRPPGA